MNTQASQSDRKVAAPKLTIPEALKLAWTVPLWSRIENGFRGCAQNKYVVELTKDKEVTYMILVRTDNTVIMNGPLLLSQGGSSSDVGEFDRLLTHAEQQIEKRVEDETADIRGHLRTL